MWRLGLIIFSFLFLNQTLLAKQNFIFVSATALGKNMDYREYDRDDILLDSEKSELYEMFGAAFRGSFVYTQMPNKLHEFGVNYYFLHGETRYVGSLLLSGDGYGSYKGKTQNSIDDMSVDYTFRYLYAGALELQAGMGVGKHTWRRSLSLEQVELYYWYSLRPKLGLLYDFGALEAGFFVEYQHGILTKMDILENSENSLVSLDLGGANITKVILPLSYEMSEHFELLMSYIYEQQEITASNSAPYIVGGESKMIYEPKSTAQNHYLQLGIALKF